MYIRSVTGTQSDINVHAPPPKQPVTCIYTQQPHTHNNLTRDRFRMALSGTTTPEYKAVQRLTADLVNAVQNDLCEVSNHLLSRGTITEANLGDFTDLRSGSAHVRTSNLIRTILNKIKMDPSNFDTLVDVLYR